MKKNIGYINLDSSMAKWLLEHVPAGELREGVEALVKQELSSLVVEAETNEETFKVGSVISYGALAINEKLRKVTVLEEEVQLTPKEYDILLFLVHNRGEVFTKEQIYQAVWESEYLMDDSNIMAFIRKLRKKIEPNPDAPQYILTVWGIGYKFNDKI